jgi:hypothetical protein
MEKKLQPEKIPFPQSPCEQPCTKVIKFYTDNTVGPNVGISTGIYTNVDGYRYINIFVKFTQEKANDAPVNLGVIFAFDQSGTMGARRYVNLEPNLQTPTITHPMDVVGSGTWHGDQWKTSSYMVRLPIGGPFIQVFVENFTPIQRKVSVWAYLVS